MMPEDDKHELLRLLSSIEDVLRCIWPEHNDFISLQQRIAMLRMMLQDHHRPTLMQRHLIPTGKATPSGLNNHASEFGSSDEDMPLTEPGFELEGPSIWSL